MCFWSLWFRSEIWQIYQGELLKKIIYQVGAPAHAGLVAPIDVVVPHGNTRLDPSQTSFFQVLDIPTKINKGTVEIITPVELIKKGDKVGLRGESMNINSELMNC